MKMVDFLIVVSISIFAVGCGTKWVKLDSTAAESSQIKEAKTKCQVEDKLYKLSYQEIATEAAINSVADAASKDDLRKGFKMKEEKVFGEINSCMEAEGLKAQSQNTENILIKMACSRTKSLATLWFGR